MHEKIQDRCHIESPFFARWRSRKGGREGEEDEKEEKEEEGVDLFTRFYMVLCIRGGWVELLVLPQEGGWQEGRISSPPPLRLFSFLVPFWGVFFNTEREREREITLFPSLILLPKPRPPSGAPRRLL